MLEEEEKDLSKGSSGNTVRLLLLSDTHELHREVEISHADLILFAGDFSMFSRSRSAIRDFNEWLGELSCPVVVVPGNHEYFLEANPLERSLLSNAVVLINEAIEIKGLKIYDSPTTPLGSGAFSLSSAADRRRLYASIPTDTDVLITHTPPYGILDRGPDSDFHGGCHELLRVVKRVKPRLHVFGHIHGAYGILETEDVTFVNAALLGPEGDLNHSPIVLRMSTK